MPPEFFDFHLPNPDGIYVYDFDKESGGKIQFGDDALRAGLRAICLGASPDGSHVAIGTAHGQTLIFSLRPDGASIEQLPRSNNPITAVCFSDSGKSVAVGDSYGQITVYDHTGGRSLVFQTKHPEEPLAACVAGGTVLLLYRDRAAFVPLETGEKSEVVRLPDGYATIDFDQYDDLVVILSGQRTGESEKLEYYVHLLDMGARRVVLTTDIPASLPVPAESRAFDKPIFLNRVRLRVSDNGVYLLVESTLGLTEYLFLAFAGDRTAAKQALDTMPDLPDVHTIRQHWLVRLSEDPRQPKRPSGRERINAGQKGWTDVVTGSKRKKMYDKLAPFFCLHYDCSGEETPKQ